MSESDISTNPSNIFQDVALDAVTPGVDYLIRLKGSRVEDMTVSITGTDKFKRHFSNIFEYFESAKDTLVEVIFSQKRALDYNGYYNAFLMNQLTEEEFLKIAEEFIYSPKIIDIKILISKISILMDLTKIDYSTSELADIFQCNNERIMEAIKQINNNNHIEGIK